jgi:lipopolysaccharide transport system ATP-binding protein
MNEGIALSLKGIGKTYRIWNSPSARLKAALLHAAGKMLPMLRDRMELAEHRLYRDFDALCDVNLELRPGDSVGIIGRNGSGKSTLLQMAAGVLTPSHGTVEKVGRVAALLELGSGFNVECTGRENVFLNATVIGLEPSEVRERFAAIADFAEIGDFMDQPVRTYSSGMAVRLAFAVLTQIDPEVLIVDEALAVGDFLFQQKCFDVIRRFRRKGCTFLFVSHSMGSVLELCDRAVLLEKGKVRFIGSADEAVRLYESTAVQGLFTNPGEVKVTGRPPAARAPDSKREGVDSAGEGAGSSSASAPEAVDDQLGSIVTDGAELAFVRIFDETATEIDVVVSGSLINLSIGVRAAKPLDDPHVGFKIRDKMGRVLFESSSYCMRTHFGRLPAGETLVANFRFCIPLFAGEYSIVVGFANGGRGEHFYQDLLLYLQGAKIFEIVKDRRDLKWSGIVNLNPKLEYHRTSAPSAREASG